MDALKLYDTYSQEIAKRLAPAANYKLQLDAATSIGVDYNKLTSQQIDQLFGPSPQYPGAVYGGSASPLDNVAYQLYGGQNPYLQRAMQYQAAMFQQQNPYGYPPQAFAGIQPMSQFAGYPQTAAFPTSAADNIDVNQIMQLLTQIQGLLSGGSDASATIAADDAPDDSSAPDLTLYNQIYSKAMASLSGDSYDAQYLQKLEEQIQQIRKDAAAEETDEAAE